MPDAPDAAARWARLEALFEAASARPTAERDPYLATACADDPTLLAEVRSLLAADPAANGFFIELGRDLGPMLPGATEAPTVGGRVGPYRLVRLVGQGGMGSVYEASRADGQFEQRVAVKLLRDGMPVGPAGGLGRRFLIERQILARLEHPHIARLLDGGVTETGQPYLAMEYVEGQPIDKYADGRKLSIEARLTLFLDVCSAVQHAHGSLIVHRDLKPSNILVTADGTAKLLDFGIAKLLEDSPTSADGPLTRTGHGPMTLAYASPEQIRGTPITTASDVYTLGVILCELLTGHHPHRVDDATGAFEAARLVCETDPTRPSALVTAAADPTDPAAVATHRDTTPERLARQLRGDLDSIVLTALRREPGRRYASAEALATDVSRHLRGLPVTARPDTAGYRAGKFIRRHRAGVAAAGLVVVALTGGLAGTLYQARQARIERDRAQAVAGFLTDLVRQADPFEARGATVTVREMLDNGAARARTALDGQPEVQSAMLTLMGDVYANLGLYAQAEPLALDALATRQRVFGPDSPEAAETMSTVAYTCFRKGEFARADSLYRAALDIHRRRNPGSPAMVNTMTVLALAWTEQGRAAEAEPLYREALALERTRVPVDPARLGGILTDLSSLLQGKRDFTEAITLGREGLALTQSAYGENHPNSASAMNALAFTLHQAGRFDEAEPLYRRSLATRRRLFAPGHPHIASSEVRYGWLMMDLNRLPESDTLLASGLRHLSAVLPPDHWHIAAARGLLGLSRCQQGRVAEGIPMLRVSLAVYQKTFGARDARTLQTLAALASVHTAIGQPEVAARYTAQLPPEMR